MPRRLAKSCCGYLQRKRVRIRNELEHIYIAGSERCMCVIIPWPNEELRCRLAASRLGDLPLRLAPCPIRCNIKNKKRIVIELLFFFLSFVFDMQN